MAQVPPPVASKEAFQRLIDGLQTLVREHLALARVELKDDLRGMGRDVLAGAAGLPALAAGYLILMISFGYLLALWLPSWAAFGIVALANLGAGAALTLRGVGKVRGRRVDLQSSSEELQQDKRWIASLGDGPRADGEGQLPARPVEGARQPPQPASH
jgi:hypothetical protein